MYELNYYDQCETRDTANNTKLIPLETKWSDTNNKTNVTVKADTDYC